MAGNIKGVTIEFRGDTTSLDKALRQITNETKKIDRELKQVDKALKFNPTNVELWRQKQDLLKQKISETKDKLALLKSEQARMDAAGVDKNSEEYRKLQREIITAESQVKNFETQLRKIGNINLRAASEQVKALGTKLTDAGNAMRGISTAAAAVTAAIGALTVKSGKWADDINTMSKKYSIGTSQLQMYAAAAELVDVDVETIAKSHVKLEKTMNTARNGTGAAAEAFDTLGISVTNADGSLRDGDTVFNETITALGNIKNETERDALAMQLFGKSAAELNPLIENGGEAYKNMADIMSKYDLDFIDQETLNAANEFNDSLDTIKSIGMIAFQQLGTQLAATFAPVLEKVVDLVGRLANWIANLDPKTQAIIGTIAAVVAAVAPLLLVLGKVAFAISSIISVVSLISAPMLGIVAVFAAVIAAGVLLYKNWDKVKAFAIKLKDSVVSTFNNLKTKVTAIFKAITAPITNAVNIIKNAINKIKSIINNAHLKLPHFKLPHFKISGGKLPWGIGGKGVAPKISVEWYAKGGIFDAASLIGVGEAGPEAVVPLDRFWDKMDKIAEGANAAPIVINVYGSNNMSVNELAAAVEQRLIQMQKRRSLAWQ